MCGIKTYTTKLKAKKILTISIKNDRNGFFN